MNRLSSETNPVLDDWDEEVFDEFVLETDSVVEIATADEFPIANLAKLKDAVARLSPDATAPTAFESTSPSGSIEPPAIEKISCLELAEAYLEDSSRGLAALDQAVIDYESNSNRDEALAQVLRELHTLKGAAAAVDLSDLGRYLHEVEGFLGQAPKSPEEITRVLITCLENLRRQSTALKNEEVAAVANQIGNESSEQPAEVTHSLDVGADGEDSIRVKGAQIDRLLDMVTSLTMLNSQRDSHVDQLRSLNAYVNQCGNRIRDLERMLNKANSSEYASDPIPSISTSMREVGNDLAEISELLRNSYSPISKEHLAVTDFTQQFRTALVSILRMPVSGMFRRLQRAALDAARVEQKQVRLEVIGSDAGLERSIQERLLDPLMHIVRNAVSHGIETPAEREQKGKDAVGTITLEAISAPNLLTLNVRDDGRGLDYEALRRRGVELNLLHDSREATLKELGQLIFQPGFSTRDEANEVAGRGIGMDVVADSLEKMHAWVEVDSIPGQGVTVTLSVPLKSIAEHSLVVRAGEHLAAFPMQYVRCADDTSDDSNLNHPELAQVMGVLGSNIAKTVLRLERGQNRFSSSPGASNSACCLVDEILGPQEVVVRPLPPLLRHQPYISGVTLSATGEVVYVLDPQKIADAIDASSSDGSPRFATDNGTPSKAKTVRILVVDDSLSARRAVAICCRDRGWEVVEAENGIAGLELLDEENWSMIVTDFDMPQMDGLEFIKAVRKRESSGSVPILMASSRSVEEMAEKAIVGGANKYVTKPVTLTVLDEFLSLHSTATREVHDRP